MVIDKLISPTKQSSSPSDFPNIALKPSIATASTNILLVVVVS
ncbi:hypothetical protein RO3G_10967 [Rhizopus delemar RA 99-880]|uniref:Uncharacterized protein n=1 Tax=Rhizopus delemar (strain RA 99-880 / ATCC MYA-4621 / FGSC 9543 / NRRL 43880) TaxID=246409 RepID=I1CCS6_RHIO9|nr:hypothetical protein RO3G_10967 [Rhizopus delemar RA 99-880]|eukprot:EIE86256.1 hypothetical protein RO3G_10967 [Rhizopus delemar RA 99-880]